MRLVMDAKRFDELYEIYKTSFPDVEQRTEEGQKAVFCHPCYRLYIREEEGKILAFLGCWDLPSCCFVEHLATTEACRGKGYGKDLILECAADTAKPIFLEIEPITEADPMTGRRAGFYQRLGFVVNAFPYEQMPLKPGDSPIPLWVMSYGETVAEDAFLPYKKEIYQMVYGIPQDETETKL